MTKRQERWYEIVGGFNVFRKQYPDVVQQGSRIAALFDALAASRAKLEQHQQNQLLNLARAHAQTCKKAEAETALRSHVTFAVQIARLAARTTRGFDRHFKLPAAKSDAALLKTAHSFADRMAKSSETFTRYAPDNFLEEFKARLLSLEQALDKRAEFRSLQIEATAALEAEFKTALRLADEVDLMMKLLLKDNPLILPVWQGHRHGKFPDESDEDDEDDEDDGIASAQTAG